MTRKQVLTLSFLSGLIFLFLLSFISYYIQPQNKNRSPDRVSQKRDLILGQPNFISPPEKDLAKHVEKQWSLKDIEILKAWKETKGNRNIVVAVIDTGIYKDHPCLKRNLWRNKKEIPGNKIDDDGNGFVDDIYGWNFVNNNNDIRDRHGHGTHIAGIIAATGKTASTPDCWMIGVAPNVTLMTLKYYDNKNHGNNVKNTIKSIEYAVKNGADIINYSGGGPGFNRKEQAAIAKAADKGVIFVSASGNESSEIGEKDKYYPASYNLPNIISLNSKDDTNQILSSSNWIKMDWRKKDDIYNQTAPGKNIISTLPPRRYLSGFFENLMRSIASTPPRNEIYGYMTGTSQATAVASGVAALIKSRYPHWKVAQVIKQVNNTGYGSETQDIKKKTNQGKKLNAYEAIIMRDQNVDLEDRPVDSSIPMPATEKALKDPQKKWNKVDAHDPGSGTSNFEVFDYIRKKVLKNKKEEPSALKKRHFF